MARFVNSFYKSSESFKVEDVTMLLVTIMTDFSKWLADEMNMRGWSDSELARRAEVSHASISYAVNGNKPGAKVCKGIARAFGITETEVFQRAGLLRPVGNEDARKRFEEFVAWLTPQEREEFWDYIEIFKAQYP